MGLMGLLTAWYGGLEVIPSGLTKSTGPIEPNTIPSDAPPPPAPNAEQTELN